MASSSKRQRSESPLLVLNHSSLLPLAIAGPVVKQSKLERDSGLPEPEKRAALFKKACPQSIQERIDRVMQQRFYCVDRQRTSEVSETFKVLGSTGNVYDIEINKMPNCSCPDGKKNGCCKHIIPQSSNLYYQKALITSELASIFMHARASPIDRTTSKLTQIYKKATGAEFEEEKSARRLPEVDDSCPICYEDFQAGQTAGLVFCESLQGCGGGVHAGCFAQWERTANPVTCVSCRATWVESKGNTAAGASYSEGYLSVGAMSGMNSIRDTSSYYDGPRRGQPYKGSSRGYGGRGYY